MARNHPIPGRAWPFIRRQDGAAGVEFALVLPLLLIFVFGAVEFGRLMHDYHVVQKSVRDAARYLTRVPADCGGISNAADLTAARNLALRGVPDASGGNPRLDYWTDPASISVAVACVDNAGAAFSGVYDGVPQIPRITVTAEVDFSFLFAALLGDVADLTLSASDQMVHIGE